MESIDFSVIVATYNPDYTKLFRTLNSILRQEKCTYEIIITDDGTKDFNIDLIKDWMKSKSVKNYKIVNNNENLGTVKNVYQGLLKAQGKFVKLISPGDFLYNSDTLYDIYSFMTSNKYDIIFGKAVYYYINNGNKFEIVKKQNPYNVKPYISNNMKKIKRAYFLYQDYILGASLTCEKSLIINYMKKIVDKVLYAEDFSVIMMTADNIQVHFFDKYVVWYEWSTGISTSGNSNWGERLKQDNKNCLKSVVIEHPELKYSYELYHGKRSIKQIIFKIIRKIRFHFLDYKIRIIKRNTTDILLEILKSY